MNFPLVRTTIAAPIGSSYNDSYLFLSPLTLSPSPPCCICYNSARLTSTTIQLRFGHAATTRANVALLPLPPTPVLNSRSVGRSEGRGVLVATSDTIRIQQKLLLNGDYGGVPRHRSGRSRRRRFRLCRGPGSCIVVACSRQANIPVFFLRSECCW